MLESGQQDIECACQLVVKRCQRSDEVAKFRLGQRRNRLRSEGIVVAVALYDRIQDRDQVVEFIHGDQGHHHSGSKHRRGMVGLNVDDQAVALPKPVKIEASQADQNFR